METDARSQTENIIVLFQSWQTIWSKNETIAIVIIFTFIYLLSREVETDDRSQSL